MSITHPGKARIALILMVSRLARGYIYPKFVGSIGLKGDEQVLDFGAGWEDTTYYIAKRLTEGGRVTAMNSQRNGRQWQKEG